MSDTSWRGQWWVPDQPDLAVPGTLHINAEGRPRLELVGGFDTDIRTPLPGGDGYTVSIGSRDFPLVHGASGPKRFTLIGTHATRSSGSGFLRDEIVMQDLRPNRILRGIHMQHLDEPAFIRAHQQLDRLLHWSARSTFKLRPLLADAGSTIRDRTAATHQVEPVTASYNDMTIRLRVRGTPFNIVHRPVANRRSMETEESATLDFDTPEPTSFDAFDTVFKDMQDLLTLSAYQACGSLRQVLIFRTSEIHPGSSDTAEVEVLGPPVFQSDVEMKEKPHHDFLFTLEDLDFPELVPRWLALKDRARLGFNILFGLRYISTGYVGTRLLGVATAAENIHRELCPTSTPLPKSTYRQLKKKIMAAIADEPDELRNFVNQGLRNDPSYYDRMLDLASIPDAEAVDRLLTNRPEWAKRLKNARHDLAHANERSAIDSDASVALWLLEVTYALLCLVAISKLGLGAEVQRRALDNPKIHHASREFAKVLTTPMS